MNYLMKSLIIGAGNLQLFPQSMDYQKEVEKTLMIVKNRAKEESVSDEVAFKRLMHQKTIGLVSIFIYFMSCLAITLFLGLNQKIWWVASLPIFSLWIIYPTIVYWKNKIIKEETDSK